MNKNRCKQLHLIIHFYSFLVFFSQSTNKSFPKPFKKASFSSITPLPYHLFLKIFFNFQKRKARSMVSGPMSPDPPYSYTNRRSEQYPPKNKKNNSFTIRRDLPFYKTRSRVRQLLRSKDVCKNEKSSVD